MLSIATDGRATVKASQEEYWMNGENVTMPATLANNKTSQPQRRPFFAGQILLIIVNDANAAPRKKAPI